MWKVILAYFDEERRIVTRTYEHATYGQAAYEMIVWIMWACDEHLDAQVLLVDPTDENATACYIKGGKIQL